MIKKLQIVLFSFAATVFNIVVTLICFAILALLYIALLIPHIPAETSFLGFPVLFVASIVLSFLIYQRALKLFLKKWPLSGQQKI